MRAHGGAFASAEAMQRHGSGCSTLPLAWSGSKGGARAARSKRARAPLVAWTGNFMQDIEPVMLGLSEPCFVARLLHQFGFQCLSFGCKCAGTSMHWTRLMSLRIVRLKSQVSKLQQVQILRFLSRLHFSMCMLGTAAVRLLEFVGSGREGFRAVLAMQHPEQ